MRNWTWAVEYTDGTVHFEADLGSFGAVDLPQVSRLIVFDTDDPATNYVVPIFKGMRPIFFRRTRRVTITDPDTIPPYYVNPDGSIKTTVLFAVCLGWQKTTAGHNVKNLTWLLHDGSVVITDRDLDAL